MEERFLTVNVVTPDGLVYDHHARIVVAKTISGEIGIMPRHAPIIAPLVIDEVRVKRLDSDTHVDWIAVNGGIMEVRDDVVSIIADSAERERDIDVSRAERAKIRAEKMIEAAQAQDDVDQLRRATVALHRAINRINVSKHG
ncbi:F0F1 ATP synthase subunit epsilon [Enterococcus asini]|uniref:ATP synthase epsilon chain n=1 Tax=Enterococcus asini ATCC 700915 TaxID=1158606 RepID=R2Q2A7_9ENTE|nr:F0F1 ATP synthase subunit epsilon [Enterococcus asini]EOH90697.1 ATP synthase epsilon chain [Enterococcus asini ATCC 700915]EOT56671.1 ATP synthase epsilon chain [Enterococcus asini ATCC 700915]MCD5029530.1 F0F1 ATP synthase subunit epsilon [Enterococcus asini]MDT2744493.1 F0F1 ATP synthase subunit epsilon [Enterococcus asini]MDT2763392.1 F0F1 ATP synthase subunit epsilon [Enterococcus asini]